MNFESEEGMHKSTTLVCMLLNLLSLGGPESVRLVRSVYSSNLVE